MDYVYAQSAGVVTQFLPGNASLLPTDVDQDGDVDFVDVKQWLILLTGVYDPLADTNGDGDVNVFDLGAVMRDFGSVNSCQPDYVAFQAVPMNHVSGVYETEIRSELQEIKNLHINRVAQAVATDSAAVDWLAYLDIAADEGVMTSLSFGPDDMPGITPKWNEATQSFDLNRVGELLAFAQVHKDHPALEYVFIIDEPFHQKHNWEIDTARMKQLYMQAKAVAPDIPLAVGFSREIARGEITSIAPTDPLYYCRDHIQALQPAYKFEGGMCDVCMISGLEFRDNGGGPQFYSDVFTCNQAISRRVFQREKNGGELLFSSVQTFGTLSGSNYYMPSASELNQMLTMAYSDPTITAEGTIDAVSFQRWSVLYEGQNGRSLGDVDQSALRDTVRGFWETGIACE